MIYYHYTTAFSLEQIIRSGVLRPSTPHYSGNLGKGVYVTTMGPDTSGEVLRETLFGTRITSDFRVSRKMEAYVKLDRNQIESSYDVQQYENRELYVIKTDVPILLDDFEWSSGLTLF